MPTIQMKAMKGIVGHNDSDSLIRIEIPSIERRAKHWR